MATRKRATQDIDEESAQRIMHALEELRAEQRAYHEAICQKLDAFEQRLNERIDRLDRTIDRLDRYVASITSDRISADIANKILN